jgi:signal transduction histidine kinase
MGHDYPWIAITVALDFAVATGYGVIAMHWWRNQRLVSDSPAKRALGTMRNIFLFCGICGYIFIPVKMVWPAWRLYDLFMLALAYYTWRYAWGARDLKVIYSELGRSTKLAADLEATREESRRKDFFLNAISHDLRTPLNGLLLQTSLAEMGVATGDEQTTQAAIREIKTSARAAADLLDSFLEYARLGAAVGCAPATSTDVGAAVRDVAAAFEATAARKGLYLRVSAPPVGALVLRSDRQCLARVLSNLVSNAIKFTDHGGVRLEVEQDPQAVRVHVTDTGVGIAPADRERLFEEFFQANNQERSPNKGFGLGLAIARRLAQQLGGDVTAESTPGHGSRFTIVLPAATPPANDGNGHAERITTSPNTAAAPVAV